MKAVKALAANLVLLLLDNFLDHFIDLKKGQKQAAFWADASDCPLLDTTL